MNYTLMFPFAFIFEQGGHRDSLGGYGGISNGGSHTVDALHALISVFRKHLSVRRKIVVFSGNVRLDF